MMTLPLVMQAAAALIGPEAAVADLHVTMQPCAASDEITVCGRQDDEKFRLRPLASDRFEPKPLRAETGILGGTAGVGTESQVFGDGSISKRVMVKLKFKF